MQTPSVIFQLFFRMKWFAILLSCVFLFCHCAEIDKPSQKDIQLAMKLLISSPEIQDYIQPLLTMDKDQAITKLLELLRDLELSRLIGRYRDEQDYRKFIDGLAERAVGKLEIPGDRVFARNIVDKIRTFVLQAPLNDVHFDLNMHIHKVEKLFKNLRKDLGTMFHPPY